MKRSGFFLYLVAFLMAATGAIASAKLANTQGYIEIPLSPYCAQSVVCNNMGATCKDGAGREVFDGSEKSSTSCGVLLKHQP